MLSEKVLRMIAGILVGVWVARYLGPKQFGIFNYVLAFTSLFSSIAKLGLDSIIVRELVNHPEKRDTYLGTAFWLKVAGACVVIDLMVLILPWISNESSTNLYILIVAAGLIFQSFEVVDFYFQSQVLAKFVSICKVTQLLLSSVIKIYLVKTDADLIWFVFVTLFDQISLAISLAIAYRYHHHKKISIFQIDSAVAKNLLRNSWPLILSGIVVTIYMRIDQIMIKEMLGEHEVGIYSAAVSLSEAFYFIPMLITTSLFPAIINAKKISEAIYIQRLRQLYTLMVWIAISIAIPMTFLSDWLVVFLYGKDYILSSNVLAINIWASVFVFLGVAFSQYLVIENLVRISFYRTFFGAIINIVLNIILIPKYGVIGAAEATLIAQIFANYFYDVFDKKLHGQLKIKTIAMINPKKAFT